MIGKPSKFLRPDFWLLIAINVWCIIYYQQHPGSFSSVLWLYWFQSVLIGVFNFMDMLTIPPQGKDSGSPTQKAFRSSGCAAFFFLFHYQAFHLAYALFIVTTGKPIDKQLLLIGVSGFAINLLLQFLQHKKNQKLHGASISKMFFLPYLRIIPMHFMILAPVFLHLQPSLVFLLLKTLADVIMYLVVE